ncbi:MAG: YhgE/Pip family protein [Gordonia sp. (in: high G+C Gram-positive bacteria)]|uniref:YhgE/Pip family protein n=1 Tax=Gordonia sp. (in: high G+C Gram-positive bacteria) TaxID=84139 RepID=UPI003BB79441
MTTAQPKTRMQRSRLFRLIVAVVVTIPLVLAAIYMWALWDPTKKVDQMPVAIVNSDVGYGDGPDKLQAGQGVADSLLESGSLGFVQVDQQKAYQGLRSGDYYFVIEIPEDFSQTLGTIATVAEAPALISVTFNDYNTLKASSIGGSAMEKIHQSVLKGVAKTTVGGLVEGVQSLGDGLRTASEGAGQLSEGAQTLSDGVNNDLAPGVGRARDGSAKVADGANQLAEGLVTLQGGTDKLGDGATQVADGIERLAGQLPLADLQRLIAQAQAALPNAKQLDTVAELVTGLQALQAGSRQIANELTDPNAQYRSGVNRLVEGSSQLQQGSAELATGMVQLDEGVGRLSDGATKLRDGAGRLDQGLSDGAEKAPDFGNQDERITLAQLISTPVAKETKYVAQAQFMGPGAATTLLIIAVFLLPIAVFMSFRGHRFLTDDESPRTIGDIARRGAAVCGVSLLAVLVAGIGIWLALDPSPDPVHLWQVVLISAAATVMNVALLSILFTAFGYIVGSITALSALMLQLFSYGGIWMIQTVPAPFQWLHWISPMTLVQHGYTAAFNGVAGFWPSFVTLLIIGVAGAAVTAAVLRFQRTRTGPATPPDSQAHTEVLVPAT